MRAPAIAHSITAPAHCPECGSDSVHTRRSIIGVVFGWILVTVGFLAAFPTMCISFILSIWGVFLIMPKHRCKDCRWKTRAR
ncbi:hypothetical protein [Bradymonas sediminis]|uniref:hypothetical protein n=1 Tax=Bradymonas sediminis TaxID=1548548 RepID=UPI0010610278|nr:hypothetical protein [Bradymonas sediminis]TDP73579.1 hypothetical protein DFR33_106223 [Bradymonas sediminis]